MRRRISFRLGPSNLAFVGLEVMRASLKFQDKLERDKTSSVHDASDERAVHPGVGLGLEGVLQEVLELPHGVGGGRLVLGGEGGALEGVVVVVRVQVHVDAVRWRHLDRGQTALFTSVLLDYYT